MKKTNFLLYVAPSKINFSKNRITNLNDVNKLIPSITSTDTFLTSTSTDTETNNKSKTKLPNIWDLVDLFIKNNPNIKYCMDYKTYYKYDNNIWSIINKDQLTRLIIKFLKSNYPKNFKYFNLKNLDDIFLLIAQHEEFSMQKAIANANSNGFLLPFFNGVLNTKTFELSSHSQNHFTTHIIPINYSKEDTIKNTNFSEFLSSIVNNNNMRLKILRACLYLIFTNNLVFQIALYIYGPGGTGKSTLVNLLIYLLGKELTLSSSITQISSKFGVASLIGKILVILNDVSLYRGQEPKNIKNLITGDPMEAEIKYKQPIQFSPNSFLILTSNVLWDIKHTTTGLSRRMIYFPFDKIPEIKELNLFKILPNGEVFGTLVPHLSGFVNWILTCPEEYLNNLNEGGAKLTELVSPDSVQVNPLHVFVKECLFQDNNSKVKLGNIDNNKTTLYGIYCYWCEINSINEISFKSFTILLLDLLNQLGWKISKKRIATGFVVEGVSINTIWKSKVGYLNENSEDISDERKINNELINLENKNKFDSSYISASSNISDSDFDNN